MLRAVSCFLFRILDNKSVAVTALLIVVVPVIVVSLWCGGHQVFLGALVGRLRSIKDSKALG